MPEDDERMMSEGELWDAVMSAWFPNADPDEIEEELDSWLKD